MLPDKDDAVGDYGIPYQNAMDIQDPTTDVGDVALNKVFGNVGMMTHTISRAWVEFTGVAYTSGTVAVIPDDHDAVWGSGTGVRPTIGETAAGIYTITWAASQLDVLEGSHSINIRFPEAFCWGVSTLVARVISKTANSITINTYSSGALNALVGTKIGVRFS